VQAEGAIGLRQGRGGKGAEQVGGIHGGLFGCLSRGALWVVWLSGSGGFLFWVFLLLPDLLLGFKRPIYFVGAFVVRRSVSPAIDATAYVMCSHVPPLLACFAFHAPR
jgi:hypothetical protein